MAICTACGKEVPAESKFCVHCGNSVGLLTTGSAASAIAEANISSQSAPTPGAIAAPDERGLAMRVVGSTVGFALLYVALMVPTYVLPYFGSNSAIMGALGAAIGRGVMPQTWAHLWFLASLILIAWMRGATVDKAFLPGISFCAALFDMMPVLNVIPLVPTVLHVVTLAIGVTGKSANLNESALFKTGQRAVMASAAMTVLAIGGSALFMMTAQKGLGTETAKPTDPFRAPRTPNAVPAVPHVAQPQASPALPSAPASASAYPKVAVEKAPPAVAAPKPAPTPASAKPASSQVAKYVTMGSNGNRAAIAAMLGDANSCIAAKRYDCAIANAKSILRLDPTNAEAARLQQRATTAQSQALQSISIN